MFFKRRSDINLIPEEEQALKLRKTRVITIIIVVALISFEVLIFVLLSTISAQEQNTQDKLATELQEKNNQWQKVASSAAEAKTVKSKISEYNKLSKEYFVIEGKINVVLEVMPKNVKLSGLKITKEGATSLSGTAPSPADIYQFIMVLNENADKFQSPVLESAEKILDAYSFEIGTTVLTK